ncbi:hypothetical protein KKH07_01795 [Patescibacteria group bacterium]|nr:hypothetical protein [Patescibacteria group bacterium]MBU1563794.1 hypothetical protein [Patescibacteria group bacterium]MBU2068587.1 hypothetical protein [Patescibacteria group bacterium]
MIEQDKYKESIKDEVIESVETPQPKVEIEPKVEGDIVITEKIPTPAPVVATPPTNQVQEPVQQTDDKGVKNQIKVLSDIAFEKGLDKAIEEAKKLNNPHILDEFHDILVDELYKKLVEAGKLEQK